MNNYQSPFSNRYGSDEMRTVFSDDNKYSTWRKLWVNLAKAEQFLGLPISDEQIEEMEDHVNDIDYELAAEYENQTHHDVMAHILAYGDQCPKAKPIIHLGATSCYVTDNTDVFMQRNAVVILYKRLSNVIETLRNRIREESGETVMVGYTHLQAAQPVTLKKRLAMWLQDLLIDADQMKFQFDNIRYLGCRGATGTSSSFLELFDGNEYAVTKLEDLLFSKVKVFAVSGQTYTRKQDYNIMSVLSGICQSASKFANDVRFLSSTGEIKEGKSKNQVGSSAMPYKENPIGCEKINSLSRYVISSVEVLGMNAATQVMERTLDDSANRRVLIPELFLATEEVLLTYEKVAENLFVDYDRIEGIVQSNVNKFMKEPTLMKAVLNGGDRQKVHEELRTGEMDAVVDNKSMDRIAGLSEEYAFKLYNGQ